MSLYKGGRGKNYATSKEKFTDPCTVEKPNASLADGVLGDERRSVMSTCILLLSHDSSPPASSLNMNYSRSRVTRRQSEWKGGEVSVAKENFWKEECWGAGTEWGNHWVVVGAKPGKNTW